MNSNVGTQGGKLITIVFVATLGWLSAASVETVLKVEGKSFEVLLSLPLDVGRFLRGKLLTMVSIPSVVGALSLLALSVKGISSIIYLPMVFLVPLVTCAIALRVYYHGTAGLALPEGSILKTLVILTLNAVTVGAISAVWYVSYPAALLIALGVEVLVIRSGDNYFIGKA